MKTKTENSKLDSTEIKFKIILDDKQIPKSIYWETNGSNNEAKQASKSVMLSIWDPQKKNTVRFDLWTKEMMHHEMSIFVFQSLLMMADTYAKATGNKELAGELQDFAEEFGIKAKIIKHEENDEITPFNLEV